MSHNYSYVQDPGLLLASERKDYDEFLYELREGLSRQATSGEERLSLGQVKYDDPRIDVEVKFYEEEKLEDVFRYRVEEEDRSVYIFDHHSGSLVLGDAPMAATASERVPVGLLSDNELDESWSPELSGT